MRRDGAGFVVLGCVLAGLLLVAADAWALEPGEQAVVQCSGELAPGTEVTYDRTVLAGGAVAASATVLDTVGGRPQGYGRTVYSYAPLAFRGTLGGRWGEYRAKLVAHPNSDEDHQLLVTFQPAGAKKALAFTLDCSHN